jgi:hypothetical protein
MSKAADIAKNAYEQALDTAEAERLAQEAKERERQAEKNAARQADFDAALPILSEWFPGVEWEWHTEGDYLFDTIITDSSEEGWPPSFKLRVERRGGGVEIKVGDFVSDSFMPGYSYFSGVVIRSAADLGRYLSSRKDKK